MNKLLELDVTVSNSYIIVEQVFISPDLPESSPDLDSDDRDYPFHVTVSSLEKFQFTDSKVVYCKKDDSNLLNFIDMSTHYVLSKLDLSTEKKIREYLVDLLHSTISYLETIYGKNSITYNIVDDDSMVFYAI